MNDTVRKLMLPVFDPDACGSVVRWTAGICVAAVAAATAILVIQMDGTPSCPGWYLAQGREGSVWVAVIFAAVLAGWMCYVAIAWKRVSRKLVLDEQARPLLFDAMRAPINLSILHAAIAWCVFCCVPLVMIFVGCLDWFW